MTDKEPYKMIRILEIAWLVIGIIAILVGAYETYTKGIEEGYLFITMGDNYSLEIYGLDDDRIIYDRDSDEIVTTYTVYRKR